MVTEPTWPQLSLALKQQPGCVLLWRVSYAEYRIYRPHLSIAIAVFPERPFHMSRPEGLPDYMPLPYDQGYEIVTRLFEAGHQVAVCERGWVSVDLPKKGK